MVLVFYTTCISVDLAQHEVFRAKVGNCGISVYTFLKENYLFFLQPTLKKWGLYLIWVVCHFTHLS